MARLKRSLRDRFEDKIAYEPTSGCWLWAGSLSHNGYPHLATEGDKPVRAHRLSYEMYRGPIPDGMMVMHHCDTRQCVNPDHLTVGVAADNTADMIRKQRGKAKVHLGEAHGRAKVTDEIVRHIRRREMTTRDYMRVYGLSQVTVDMIKRRASWKHVADD